MTKENCVFCKIARGEIPADKVYEDDKILAFLDINPYAKGHTLVINKKHVDWLWDMNSKEYSYLMKKVYFLAKVLRKTFNTNWVEEVVAGIGVQHTHVHLMPRVDGDGLGELPQKPLLPKPSDKEMEEIAAKIRASL